MTSGRTIWQAQDAGWWRRERIVLLGEQFGSEGPAIANWLECEAKAQNAGGKFKAGYATAARGSFVEGGAERAKAIVAFAVEIGFLEAFEEGDRTFRAVIAAYRADQGTGREALRKRDQRAGDPDIPGHPGTDPDDDGPVPGRPVAVSETGEERTGEQHLAGERRVTFDRKPVPPARLALAERILTEFNRQAGTNYGAYTGRGAPSEDLRRIIGALTDAVPVLEFDEAQRMIEAAMRRPYWEGRPGAGVVFGPKVIGRYREQARRAEPRAEGSWSRGFVQAVTGDAAA